MSSEGSYKPFFVLNDVVVVGNFRKLLLCVGTSTLISSALTILAFC